MTRKRQPTPVLVDTLDPEGSVREFRDTQLLGFGVRIFPSGFGIDATATPHGPT